MGHFSVAVFRDSKEQSVKEMLAPYESGYVPKNKIQEQNFDSYTTWSDWDSKSWTKDFLITKDKKKRPASYVSYLDFNAMRKREKRELMPYGRRLRDKRYDAEYAQMMYKDEADYIKIHTTFHTFAVITPDGKWHEPYNLTRFSMEEDEIESEREWIFNYYEDFMKPALENNWHMTVVNCNF